MKSFSRKTFSEQTNPQAAITSKTPSTSTTINLGSPILSLVDNIPYFHHVLSDNKETLLVSSSNQNFKLFDTNSIDLTKIEKCAFSNLETKDEKINVKTENLKSRVGMIDSSQSAFKLTSPNVYMKATHLLVPGKGYEGALISLDIVCLKEIKDKNVVSTQTVTQSEVLRLLDVKQEDFTALDIINQGEELVIITPRSLHIYDISKYAIKLADNSITSIQTIVFEAKFISGLSISRILPNNLLYTSGKYIVSYSKNSQAHLLFGYNDYTSNYELKGMRDDVLLCAFQSDFVKYFCIVTLESTLDFCEFNTFTTIIRVDVSFTSFPYSLSFYDFSNPDSLFSNTNVLIGLVSGELMLCEVITSNGDSKPKVDLKTSTLIAKKKDFLANSKVSFLRKDLAIYSTNFTIEKKRTFGSNTTNENTKVVIIDI